ncbi:cadherin repeat domain-containing protein, partial [Vibrio lentus]
IDVNPAQTVDVNDPLVITIDSIATLTEDAVSAGTQVAELSATDEDGGDIQFSLTDDTNNYFNIDEDSGVVTLTAAGAAHVNAGNDLPDFNVKAESTTGNTSEN